MMSHRRRMLFSVVGITVVTVMISNATAQNTPPTLSEEEIQKIEKALPGAATAKPAKPRKVLVFWRCEGFFHGDGIAAGNKALEMMGQKTGAYSTVISDDMAMFAPQTLSGFDAVIFQNTTSLAFENPEYREALLSFVQGGKGIVGTHSAVDNFYKWPEGAAMMGALFDSHPWQEAPVKLDDPQHPLLKAFNGKGFWVQDEMYKMRDPYSREKLRVLLSFDMSRLPSDAPVETTRTTRSPGFSRSARAACSIAHSAITDTSSGTQPSCDSIWTASSTPWAICLPTPLPAHN